MGNWRHLAVLPLLLAACGCARDPDVYDVPIADAYARLAAIDIKQFRMARQCGILIHFATTEEPGEAITWRVTSSSRPMVWFKVRLAAETASSTRVTIEVQPSPEGGEMYDGKKSYPRPALNQPLRPALKELVEAALEQRPYDVMRIPEPRNTDPVCSIQRAGLESGKHFRVDDIPNMDARQSAEERARQANEDGFDSDESTETQGEE